MGLQKGSEENSYSKITHRRTTRTNRTRRIITLLILLSSSQLANADCDQGWEIGLNHVYEIPEECAAKSSTYIQTIANQVNPTQEKYWDSTISVDVTGRIIPSTLTMIAGMGYREYNRHFITDIKAKNSSFMLTQLTDKRTEIRYINGSGLVYSQAKIPFNREFNELNDWVIVSG